MSRDLAQLEDVVKSGMGGFREAGRALKEIRDRRLFQTGFPTWEVYCRGRWRLSARHANRLIAVCEVGRFLGPIGPGNYPASPAPANEGQAHELAIAPAAQRRRIMEQATARGQPTAAQIRAARQEIEDLSPEEKFTAAAAAEAAARGQLAGLEREQILGRIDRLCGRLRELHAKLPAAEAADRALDAYLKVVHGAKAARAA